MGHGKLKRFLENETFECLLQPQAEEVMEKSGNKLIIKPHPVKGNWNRKIFKNDNPIILELGCGKGEYTIDLAQRNPDCNYIGVDIKGARLWKGAKFATENKLPNVAFLRTRIEFIEAFFAPSEISEIWLTFSDPQIKSENSRLSSPVFMKRYANFLRPDGILHLKTDSLFLHRYTKAMAEANDLQILACTEDLYGEKETALTDFQSVCGKDAARSLVEVQTFYERMFLAKGMKITYLAVLPKVCSGDGTDTVEYVYPDFDFGEPVKSRILSSSDYRD